MEVTPQLVGMKVTKTRAAKGKALRRTRGNANRISPTGNRLAAKSMEPVRRDWREAPASATVAMVTAMEAVTPLVSCTDAGSTVQVEFGSGAAGERQRSDRASRRRNLKHITSRLPTGDRDAGCALRGEDKSEAVAAESHLEGWRRGRTGDGQISGQRPGLRWREDNLDRAARARRQRVRRRTDGHVVAAVVAKSPVVSRVNAFSGTPPLLVTVTACPGLVPETPQGPKLIVVGSAEIPAGAKPDPVNATVCGWPYMSLMVSVPISGPTWVGK